MQSPVWECRFAFTQIFINTSLNFREMKILCAQKYQYNQSNSTRNCSIHEIDGRGRLVQFSPAHPSQRIKKRLDTPVQCGMTMQWFLRQIWLYFFRCILFAVHLALMFIVTPKELSQGRCSRCTLFNLILSPQSWRRSHCWGFFCIVTQFGDVTALEINCHLFLLIA